METWQEKGSFDFLEDSMSWKENVPDIDVWYCPHRDHREEAVVIYFRTLTAISIMATLVEIHRHDPEDLQDRNSGREASAVEHNTPGDDLWECTGMSRERATPTGFVLIEAFDTK